MDLLKELEELKQSLFDEFKDTKKYLREQNDMGAVGISDPMGSLSFTRGKQIGYGDSFQRLEKIMKKLLAKDIKDFIDKYAGIRPDFNPEYDEECEKYTSPDASELLYASERLAKGELLERFPWSEHGSGGYKMGKDVFEEHQALLERVKPFIKK